MNRRDIKSEGIVLTIREYGEADKILTIFTKDFGKVTYLAKGAKRLTSRKRGNLEVFNNIRFSGIKAHGMPILQEVDIIESFPGIRADLKRISLAYYLMEILYRVTNEGEKNNDLYNLTLSHLYQVERESLIKPVRLSFIEKSMTALGFWPKGKVIINHDALLEDVLEQKVASFRVAKKLLID
jgi:DNA repair protein RecO (recombination protein O)